MIYRAILLDIIQLYIIMYVPGYHWAPPPSPEIATQLILTPV